MNHNPIKVLVGFVAGTPFLGWLMQLNLHFIVISLIQLVFFTGLYLIYDKIVIFKRGEFFK